MKKILERYPRTDDDKLIIDIYAGKPSDIYNEFDKFAPYIKKELEWDLVEYLIDSVQDIGQHEFVIQLRFNEAADETLLTRIRQSISNYFIYLVEREKRELSRLMRTSAVFLIVGLIIMSLSVLFNLQLEQQDDVMTHIFAAGLTVAAWVALWEALAMFLVNWVPHRQRIKQYQRLAHADVIYSG